MIFEIQFMQYSKRLFLHPVYIIQQAKLTKVKQNQGNVMMRECEGKQNNAVND